MAPESSPHVLVVEDQLSWRRLYNMWLKDFCRLTFTGSRREAVESIHSHPYEVVILDLGIPEPEDGLKTLQDLLAINPVLKVIVVSCYSSKQHQLQVQDAGAFVFFQKDEHLAQELPILIRKAQQMVHLEQENRYLRKQFRSRQEDHRILGESPEAKRLQRALRQAAQSDISLIITGPTGSGKTYFARTIHQLSERAPHPFVHLNCANFPFDLIESELFGHARGAFTGADSRTSGKFLEANGGTLFLDEIGDLPIGMQAKLLQVIEEKRFYPVGSHENVEVDVRILAATNHDLQAALKKGTFREDLYYRLSVMSIYIPPLQQRKEDIPLYFDYFLKKVSLEEGSPLPRVENQVYELITEYPWPGNLRQLRNFIHRLVIEKPHRITTADLQEQIGSSFRPFLMKALKHNYNLEKFNALYAKE
ncbi:MAG: sigma-54 dependent transcriptional regulator, partial [Calditrichia bacterium]